MSQKEISNSKSAKTKKGKGVHGRRMSFRTAYEPPERNPAESSEMNDDSEDSRKSDSENENDDFADDQSRKYGVEGDEGGNTGTNPKKPGILESSIIKSVMRTTNIEKFILMALCLDQIAKLVDNRKQLKNNDVVGKVSDQIHRSLFLALVFEFQIPLNKFDLDEAELIEWMDNNEEAFFKHLVNSISPASGQESASMSDRLRKHRLKLELGSRQCVMDWVTLLSNELRNKGFSDFDAALNMEQQKELYQFFKANLFTNQQVSDKSIDKMKVAVFGEGLPKSLREMISRAHVMWTKIHTAYETAREHGIVVSASQLSTITDSKKRIAELINSQDAKKAKEDIATESSQVSSNSQTPKRCQSCGNDPTKGRKLGCIISGPRIHCDLHDHPDANKTSASWKASPKGIAYASVNKFFIDPNYKLLNGIMVKV